MPDNDKLITLDNLGTFKDNIEEEIREGSLNTPEVIILSSTSGTLDSETLNKLKAHPAHYVLNVGGGNIYYFSVENGSGLQYDTKVITGSLLETKYLFINKATGDLSTGTTGPELVEVVEYQTTTPLTSKQVAKAQAGKLAVLDDNQLFVLFSKDSNTVTFAAHTVSYQDGHYSQARYTLRQQRRVLTISSRMFTQASFTEYHLVADIVEDFIGNTDTPNASGKQIVRALNLRRTQDMLTPNVYSASATYAVGDVVIYQNQLYRCTTAITTAEAWDATHWESTNVVELAQDKGANIVEVPNLGVQTEEMAAKIKVADGILRSGSVYWRYSTPSSGRTSFVNVSTNKQYSIIYNTILEFNPTERTVYTSNNTITVLPREKIISEFSTAKSYSPGDIVLHDTYVWRCITAHQGTWLQADFTQAVLADEIHSDIVTITSTGVQSDEMDVKIRNAKALVYNDVMYVKSSYSSSYIEFVYNNDNNQGQVYHSSLSYNVNTKSVQHTGLFYNRVTSIGGKRGSVDVDSSLQATGSTASSTLGLTGKLPYLTTAPTADNTSGFLTIVVLPSEPDTRYSGYMYVITGSNS